MNYSRYHSLDVFIYFLISLLQSSLRINPGQGQNNQLFGCLMVSVKSIEKVTSTQERVQKYCNWRKEALFLNKDRQALDNLAEVVIMS